MSDYYQLSVFSRSLPEISDVVFDAEFKLNIRTSATATKYATEDGFVVNNGIIQNPDIVRMSLGVGATPLSGLIRDPLGSVMQNWSSYLFGAVSNFIDSGTALYFTGLFQNILIQPDKRQGGVFAAMQAIKISGQPIDLLLHDIGLMKNMFVIDVNLSREDRDDVL
ncbi:phage baseplate protein, partial [Vibrio lentus]